LPVQPEKARRSPHASLKAMGGTVVILSCVGQQTRFCLWRMVDTVAFHLREVIAEEREARPTL